MGSSWEDMLNTPIRVVMDDLLMMSIEAQTEEKPPEDKPADGQLLTKMANKVYGPTHYQ